MPHNLFAGIIARAPLTVTKGHPKSKRHHAKKQMETERTAGAKKRRLAKKIKNQKPRRWWRWRGEVDFVVLHFFDSEQHLAASPYHTRHH